jgi:hypothetical protein
MRKLGERREKRARGGVIMSGRVAGKYRNGIIGQ